MNIILLDQQPLIEEWSIQELRQVEHIQMQLKSEVGDTLKVGVLNGKKYLTQITQIEDHQVKVKPIQEELVPNKLPIHLVVALPRPRVLRRLIMDSVTMGVEKITLLQSNRVEKSYWQTPLLQQLDEFVQLGLEQAGDTIVPKIDIQKRFRPFVEDILPTIISKNCPAYVAHPYVENQLSTYEQQGCTVIIGPEGGFIPYEIDLFIKNGCQTFTLGNRILRTETAISYILGALAN